MLKITNDNIKIKRKDCISLKPSKLLPWALQNHEPHKTKIS